MRVSIKGLVGIVLLATAAAFSGCTLLGYGIGSGVDSSNARALTLQPDSAIALLDAGDELVCITTDGSNAQGAYAGVREAGGTRSLRLLTPEKLQYVDFSTIISISFHYDPTSGRETFTVLGLAADAAIVAAIAISTDKAASRGSTGSWTYGGTGSSGSSDSKSKGGILGSGYNRFGCPIVEGWDGNAWRREAECLTGAFHRAAWRSDVARLPHARPEDGLLRVRVHDVLPETDSIDRVSVFAVEHAVGTVVYPTEEGRLLAVRPESPLSATDDRGRDILPRLCRGDEDFWLALPVADAARRGERRAFECRFPLSVETDSVTLLLRVRNTQWGSMLQTDFLSMFGRELQAQYDRLNADATERAFLRRRFEEEGMLAVSIWDGQGWRSAGTIWEVGPEAWRDLARRIDVRGIEAGELRIRFDAPAAIWMVDHVALDASAPSDIRVTTLHPELARDSEDRIRTADLTDDDGVYVSLEQWEWVEAAFRVPSTDPAPGMQRSWLVELSGYYRARFAPDTPPRRETIARILGERGFFAKYADGKFWESVMALDGGMRR